MAGPASVKPTDVRISSDGAVAIFAPPNSASSEDAARSVLSLLAFLLVAAGPGVPPTLLGLSSAVRSRATRSSAFATISRRRSFRSIARRRAASSLACSARRSARRAPGRGRARAAAPAPSQVDAALDDLLGPAGAPAILPARPRRARSARTRRPTSSIARPAPRACRRRLRTRASWRRSGSTSRGHHDDAADGGRAPDRGLRRVVARRAVHTARARHDERPQAGVGAPARAPRPAGREQAALGAPPAPPPAAPPFKPASTPPPPLTPEQRNVETLPPPRQQAQASTSSAQAAHGPHRSSRHRSACRTSRCGRRLAPQAGGRRRRRAPSARKLGEMQRLPRPAP